MNTGVRECRAVTDDGVAAMRRNAIDDGPRKEVVAIAYWSKGRISCV